MAGRSRGRPWRRSPRRSGRSLRADAGSLRSTREASSPFALSSLTSGVVIPNRKKLSSPTCSRISTLAPSSVPMVSAPFIWNFMLPVPEASLPASEICSDRSAAGKDQLRVLDVVVREEHDLQLAPHRRIAVDQIGDAGDQSDHQLGHIVPRRRLAAEDHGARRHLEVRIVLQALVQRDDVQQVEVLPLVLMDAFDLNVEHRCWIDIDIWQRALSRRRGRSCCPA